MPPLIERFMVHCFSNIPDLPADVFQEHRYCKDGHRTIQVIPVQKAVSEGQEEEAVSGGGQRRHYVQTMTQPLPTYDEAPATPDWEGMSTCEKTATLTEWPMGHYWETESTENILSGKTRGDCS